MKTFLSLPMIVAMAMSASAQTATQPPRESGFPETVSVTGTGRVTLVPDRFTFTVGVQTMAPTVEQAVNENNARVASVVAALKKGGATSEEIRTANFSIYPQQQYEQGHAPRVVGYQVTNSIVVTKREIAEAGKLLQVAIGAGVNESSGLQFEVSDQARGRDPGLRAAFDDARAKASILAQAAGRTLGRAMVITEGTQVTPMPRPMPMGVMAAKAEAVTEVPVQSGTREVSYTVSVIFDLR